MSTPDKETTALVPKTEGSEQRDALMRALGFDKLQPAQAELELAIAQRYDLDPMLRHIVMVDGKPYITRDGLLHVAWKSGVFDGIEVDRPTLDEDKRYYRTEARVYRKDIQRPFRYPGRYPATGGNARYNEEMCIKVAEVMTLRRAFDVAAPVLEEQWDGEIPEGAPTSQPSSLAERVAQRALAAGNSQEQPVADASDASASIVEPETSAPALTVVEQVREAIPDERVAEARDALDEEDESVAMEALVTALAEEEEDEDEESDEPEPEPVVSPLRQPETPEPESLEPEQAPTDDADPLDLFKAWARDKEIPVLQKVAKDLFPNAGGFKELNAKELGVVQHAYEKEIAKRSADSTSERCGDKSPLSDNACTLDPGHKGQHRHGTRETW